MAGDNSVVVLDVSSDDDAGWRNGVADGGGGGGGGVVCRDDGDWISEIFDAVDKKNDSDDVVVVREVSAKPKLRVSKTLVKCGTNDDDDDDDCVVLDGDPYKPISPHIDRGVDDDSEDLLVVSEKGQVACRDYPHARHLCVIFPFNVTPHERHCDQCHCYVCDSLAPCLHWNTSVSHIDHCHATDKDQFWKSQRKSLKKTNDSLPVVSRVPSAPFAVGQPLPCQTTVFPSEYVPRYGTQNTVAYGMNPQPGYCSGDRILPHGVSSVSRSAHNSVVRGDRRHSAVRRKATSASVFPSNPYNNNISRRSYGNQFYGRNPPIGKLPARPIQRQGEGTPALNIYKDSSQANFGGIATNSVPNLSAQTNMGSGTANYTPSQHQIFTPPLGSSVNKNTVGPQHHSSQIFVGSNYTSSMPVQPAVGTESNWICSFDNSSPFQYQATSHAEGANIPQISMPSESLVTMLSNLATTAQPNACPGSVAYQSQFCSLPVSLLNNAGKNVSLQATPAQSGMSTSSTDLYQSQVCSLPTSLSNAAENTSVQGNPTQSAIHSSSKDFDFKSHSDQALPVNQLENSVQRNEPPVPLYGNSDFTDFTNNPQLGFQFDPWIFENDTGLDAFGNPEVNVCSPEAGGLDGGIFNFS